MKFAYLVCFELRCLKYIDKLYKHIIDYYDADIFICVQETPKVKDKIKLFDRKVKKVKIIKKTECAKVSYFQNFDLDQHGGGNFRSDPMLNFYINLIEMGKFIKDEIKNYDYFILLRTDIDILFNFPKKKFFEKMNPSIFTMNANYNKRWGGWGQNLITHRNYIYKSLTCFDEIFRNNKLIKNYYKDCKFRHANQETFSNYCYSLCDFKFNYINDLNFWFTIDINSNEEMDYYNKHKLGRVTVHYSKSKNIFYKYKKQMHEAFNNLKKVNDNYKWILDNNNNFSLKK